MKNATVIIGAGFGDEGKGLATDYHAARNDSDADTLVVRFNGGAQAGHTVTTRDGRHHIFSHIGSGSLVGAATWLSRFFVSHPILFFQEYDALQAIGAQPTVWVDPDSPVTTPFDIMLNQASEAARGNARHGSCGMGFGETIERQLQHRFALYASDLNDTDRLRRALLDIREHYLPQRLQQIGLPPLAPALRDDGIIEHFIDDGRRFSQLTRLRGTDILDSGQRLIFEGAQGLLLDMDRGRFPHVTRSNTGLKNVVALVRQSRIEQLDVHYISRVYSTRHGAGPMRSELPAAPFPQLIDHTNRRNDWQGDLRHGWLDIDQISDAVLADLSDAQGLTVRHQWLLSWMNGISGTLTTIENGRPQHGSGEALATTLQQRSGADGVLLGFGKQREDIIPLAPQPGRIAA